MPCHTTDARTLISPGAVVDLTNTGAVPQRTGAWIGKCFFVGNQLALSFDFELYFIIIQSLDVSVIICNGCNTVTISEPFAFILTSRHPPKVVF